MRIYFTMLLIAAVVSFLVTPLARRLAFWIGAVDRPDHRKIHREPTARLGGLAVVAGFSAPLLALILFDQFVADTFRAHRGQIATLIGCGLVMFTVGAIDDVFGLSAWRKLVIQLAVATAMYFLGFQINQLSNPLGGSWSLGWLSLPVTVLWIVGLTNAINLLDGMDGLVAGIAAVIALSLAMINLVGHNVVVALLTFALAGAALGFLPYNFAPARIFLGDSGSLFVGVVMAGISTLSFFKAATAAVVLMPALLFAIPLFDTTMVVVGRLRRRQHPFSPDRTHIHHRLLELGLDAKQAATFLYLVTLFLGVSSILLSWKLTSMTFAAVASAAVVLCAALVALWRRLNRAPEHLLEENSPDGDDLPPST